MKTMLTSISLSKSNLENKMESVEYVEYLLKNYHDIQSEIELLKFELESYQGINDVEVIETLCFFKPEGERISCSDVSDKTSKVALVYRQAMNRMNDSTKKSIKSQILLNEVELSKLEFEIKRLKEPLKSIIKSIYIDCKNREKIKEELFISEQTINRYRKSAIKKISLLF